MSIARLSYRQAKEALTATMCLIIVGSIENGGEAAFDRLREVLRSQNLGMLLDIVPNHMAIGGRDSRWWWDVLENGQSSRYAPYFDVDWFPPESKLHHRVMLPVLADHYGRILDAGDIRLTREEGTFTIQYHDHVFPVSPRSVEFVLTRAASEAASDYLAFFADALAQLPSSRATDWASLRRRHRDKGILLNLLTRLLQEHDSTAAAVDRTIDAINKATGLCTNCSIGKTTAWLFGGRPRRTWAIEGFLTLIR